MEYLAKQEKKQRLKPEAYLEGGFSGVTLQIDKVIEQAKRAIEKERKAGGWGDFEERFSNGMECAGTVDGIQDYGVFVRLDGGPTGLLYFRNLPSDRSVESFKYGNRLIVKILDMQVEAQKVSLGFVGDEERAS